VIEKIVDYIHYNPSDGVKSLNAFKHNRENEVKIRVFSVLEAVLREVRKSFLSFIVVDVFSDLLGLKSNINIEANQLLCE